MALSDYIIDIQSFLDKDGEFIPKEIAIIGVNTNFYNHWIIKPPHSYNSLSTNIKKKNSHATIFHHGLEWKDGESNMEDVFAFLRRIGRNARTISVHGLQKVKVLERAMGREILNLEEYYCPSLKNLPSVNDHYCCHHGLMTPDFACALTYAYKLRIWLKKILYVSKYTYFTNNDDEEVDEEKKDIKKVFDNNLKPKDQHATKPSPPETNVTRQEFQFEGVDETDTITKAMESTLICTTWNQPSHHIHRSQQKLQSIFSEV